MNFKKNDVVTIEGTVKYDCNDGDSMIIVSVRGRDLSIEQDGILLRRPFLAVGDIVTFKGNECRVVAVNDDDVWIQTPCGGNLFAHIDLLVRA